MKYRNLVYKHIANSPKGKVELIASPRTYYGSNKVSASYILRLNKFELGKAFVWRIEFEGKTEDKVFENAYKFIQSRGTK